MNAASTGTYADVPLPKSKYGRTYYEKGRELIASHGVVLREVVWDADEVLWDWVMDLSGMARAIPRLIKRDLSHREFFRVKPGVFELIWGMHHESKERGEDPFMRVWTDGYPWRMWRINQSDSGRDFLRQNQG